MIDAIATSLAGLQKASAQANTAAQNIANPATYSRGSQDIVDISAEGMLSSNSLEASVIGLKIAATSYKANGEALSSILEMQKEAFDQLV